MKNIKIYILLGILALGVISCKPDPEPTEAEILNEWIWDVMNEVYLWTDNIDQNLYPTDETDPEAFFYSLLYSEDRFSWIVDDVQELLNSFNNVGLSSGISPYFIRLYNSDDVIIVVEYVIPRSPADLAGIKRGDIISEINGTTIDIDNYIELFYSEDLLLGFAEIVDQNLVSNGKEKRISAVVIEENPVLHTEIIDYENKRIGYMVYTGFSSGEENQWIDSLDYALSGFMDAQVDDIIMDIRYNPGGKVFVAQHIASVLSPASVVASGNDNVFVNYEWNSGYQDYFLQTEGKDSENLIIPFEADPPYNLDLSDIYFLTSGHSASASELIIIGLRPYMNVRQIGEYTYGKCYGSFTIPDTEEPARHNWAMQPIVFKFANSLGYTDFVDGLVPDIEIEDDIINAQPFGDLNDPIIAKALEEITGVAPKLKKVVPKTLEYEVLRDPVREAKTRSLIQQEPVFLK